MLKRRGFTLIELLVVMTVISLLAAILFPVLTAARTSALKASCISNFRQVSQATQLYLGDYDEIFPPVNHEPGTQSSEKTDRTWVQLLLPYTGSFQTFKCPSDAENLVETDATFDQDLVPGDLFARYYNASMHVNVGYNFQYLAPILKEDDRWESHPKSVSALADPSEMLMFIDSVWEVKDGEPVGGGSFLVAPPCRFEEVAGGSIDTITSESVETNGKGRSPQIFAPLVGWQSASGEVYGGAWPWHNGRATTAMVDGSARAMTMPQLAEGCDIRPAWKGNIIDRHQYLWSPE